VNCGDNDVQFGSDYLSEQIRELKTICVESHNFQNLIETWSDRLADSIALKGESMR
jgi:hypothetical protein